MTLILGIDEAGRGPLLGPLVMAGITIKKEQEKKLKNLGVKDSKLLTKEQRESLYQEILNIADKYKIIITEPEEIDKAVNGHEGLNLNWLEAKKSIEIINSLKPDEAIIDCPSTNVEAFKNYIQKELKTKTKLILEHKADYKYPVVAAASILAKVTRDNAIEKIKKEIKIDFGSGYMSDPKTSKFLGEYHKTHEKLFRKSWMPYKNIIIKKNQTTLGDFSAKKNPKEKKIIKKLEKLGYQKIPVKTSHESLRLKGSCTVTLYKTGKILVQGKEEEKKRIEKLLN